MTEFLFSAVSYSACVICLEGLSKRDITICTTLNYTFQIPSNRRYLKSVIVIFPALDS